jgi:hypothetical protein
MTPRTALALSLLLAFSCPSLASGPSVPGSEAVKESSGATNATPDPSAANSEGQDTNDAAGKSESGDQQQAPIDVHRHRPGACPEGPPCKGDE